LGGGGGGGGGGGWGGGVWCTLKGFITGRSPAEPIEEGREKGNLFTGNLQREIPKGESQGREPKKKKKKGPEKPKYKGSRVAPQEEVIFKRSTGVDTPNLRRGNRVSRSVIREGGDLGGKGGSLKETPMGGKKKGSFWPKEGRQQGRESSSPKEGMTGM